MSRNTPASTLIESGEVFCTQTDRWTDRQADSSIPPKTLVLLWYNNPKEEGFSNYMY